MYLDGSSTAKSWVGYSTLVAGNYFSCWTQNLGGTQKWFCANGVGSAITD
jgi:hypothetical protein